MHKKTKQAPVDMSRLANCVRLVDAIRESLEYVVDQLEVRGSPEGTTLPQGVYRLLKSVQNLASTTDPQAISDIPTAVEALVLIRPVTIEAGTKDFLVAIWVPVVLNGNLRVIRSWYESPFHTDIANYVYASRRDVTVMDLEEVDMPTWMRRPLNVALYFGLCNWGVDAYLELKRRCVP